MSVRSFRLISHIFCMILFMSLWTVTKAQDTTPTSEPATEATAIPTMDMSAHEAAPMVMLDDGETTIRFAARVGEKDFACGITYDGLGSDSSSVQFSDFRLYVSNVRLIDASGSEVPLTLDQDGLWQSENVALIDFEDGTGACGEGGNDVLRTTVVGTAPEGDYTGIAFELGVPFELNHLDISTAASPLNLDAMWWGWQVGFKFLRVDMTANGEPYFIHLGSTGCASANETTAPDAPCSKSNRLEVSMDNFDTSKNFVIADLASLVNGVGLSKSEPRPPGCMSGPDDPDCTALFPNLGLSLETGAQTEENIQKLFRMG